MRVIDSGHCYQLDTLDGESLQLLTFVKREGPGYPGNVGHHLGTTSQEVIRALIERANYVNNQVPCPETTLVISLLTTALYLLESRAARRHGRSVTQDLGELVCGSGKCEVCGHVGCMGGCRA